ncbi:MAG TPA: hypothetical protein VFM14_18440 [Gemmatimonadales bacterium]|nr:hypothetical protein [Gemmatimonadales bacterium]
MATVQNDVKAGDWRTVFSMWGSGVKRRGVFTRPAGMQIKVRYGWGWFGRDRQKQTLDGINPKTLSVGGVTTYLRVRFQVKVQSDTTIFWEHIIEGPQT